MITESEMSKNYEKYPKMNFPNDLLKNNQPERSKREDSQNIDEWLNSPESKEGIVELGTCTGIRFITSEGEKRMEPGKRYDQKLNEL